MVASGGPERERLQAIAQGAPNTDFGWQTEDSLPQWVANAHAVDYLPVDEDFGMSPVECMAARMPVIGVAEGGLGTAVHGQTGVLIQGQPDLEKLQAAVHTLELLRPANMRAACEARAALFDETCFVKAIKRHLATVSEARSCGDQARCRQRDQ